MATDGSPDLSSIKAASEEASFEPSFLYVATAGNRVSQQPDGPFLKTLPVLQHQQQEGTYQETMEETPVAGDTFRHPVPYEECRLPTVGVPCKATVIDPPLNSDGAVPSAESLITSGGAVLSAEPLITSGCVASSTELSSLAPRI